MDKLIPIINKLQDVFSALNIDSLQLPMIAVVGSQSSGKSSVLENIVGRDFLPRGTGIVTRCPLILQLHHVLPSSSTGSCDAEWGVFAHLPNVKMTDFGDICQEIINQTDRLTGKNLGISSTPIELKIYSPNVVNLTLVDLPGITKVPVGDQPEDIEEQIRSLIDSFIRNPNCIILAVSAANSDIANSDALKFARDVDPLGARTIAVCTKLDLMDEGTDALDVLKGKVVTVKLGVVGVVNRSQRDIINHTPISKAREAEVQYFRTHPVYSQIAHRAGTSFLVTTLNSILLHHIRDCLPDLRNRISYHLASTHQRLLDLGGANNTNNSISITDYDKAGALLNILTGFTSDYIATIDGTSRELSTAELSGGARISYIFHETFGATLDSVSALDGLEPSDIRTAIKNATGARMALFVPEVCFEILVKKQISRLSGLAVRCADLVYEEMMRITYQCLAGNTPSATNESTDASHAYNSANSSSRHDTIIGTTLSRYENLNKGISQSVMKLLQERMVPTLAQINNLFGMELAYINTNHPDFIGGQEAVQNLHQRTHSQNNQHYPMMSDNLDPSMYEAIDIGHNINETTYNYTSNIAQTTNIPSLLGNVPVTNPNPSGTLLSRFSLWKTTTSPQTDDIHQSLSSNNSNKNNSNLNASTVTTHQQIKVGAANTQYTPNQYNPMDPMNEREQMEIDLIKALITSYFEVVRKNVQDQVPKAIMFFLVNHIKDHLQSYLISSLYNKDQLDFLLAENQAVVDERKDLSKRVDALKHASEILAQVRDVNLSNNN